MKKRQIIQLLMTIIMFMPIYASADNGKVSSVIEVKINESILDIDMPILPEDVQFFIVGGEIDMIGPEFKISNNTYTKIGLTLVGLEKNENFERTTPDLVDPDRRPNAEWKYLNHIETLKEISLGIVDTTSLEFTNVPYSREKITWLSLSNSEPVTLGEALPKSDYKFRFQTVSGNSWPEKRNMSYNFTLKADFIFE